MSLKVHSLLLPPISLTLPLPLPGDLARRRGPRWAHPRLVH